jgi:hypothetical protein
MIHSEFILLIFNCQKYKYKAEQQKQTWLKDFTYIPYFHVIGDESINANYKFDLEQNILYVNTPDDYVSLPKKVIAAYHAVKQEYDFKYIFKTDDDQHLTYPDFFKTIISVLLHYYNTTKKIHYGGHIIDVIQPYLSKYNKIHPELPDDLPILTTKYCSGRFYLLSNVAVSNLLSKRNHIEREFLEDYAIGYYLSNYLKTTALKLQTNTYFIDNYL